MKYNPITIINNSPPIPRTIDSTPLVLNPKYIIPTPKISSIAKTMFLTFIESKENLWYLFFFHNPGKNLFLFLP